MFNSDNSEEIINISGDNKSNKIGNDYISEIIITLFGDNMKQCQLEGKDFSQWSTKLLTPYGSRLTLTYWWQNFADIHSFPSMYDIYRQLRSNSAENND